MEQVQQISQAEERRDEVRRSIKIGSRLSAPFIVMNTLASIVASYGLLADSTAVVIGAMIIALLLGPIMGLALAMVDGDTRLFRAAMVAEVVGAALVVFISWFVAKIHPDLEVTREILSRTKPNLIDMAIALAGGAAGAYATLSPRVSAGLVGVAISTALVPPLAACGICLSKGLFPQAGGAFVLFFTNLVAIQSASSLVLYSFGFHLVTVQKPGDRAYGRRLAADGAILLILAIFLYLQLSSSIAERRFESDVRSRLVAGLLQLPGTYLAETRFISHPDRDIVVAVVRVPYSIPPKETARLQALLVTRGGKPIELHVRSMITKETTTEGYLHEIEPQAQPADAITPSKVAPSTEGSIETEAVDERAFP